MDLRIVYFLICISIVVVHAFDCEKSPFLRLSSSCKKNSTDIFKVHSSKKINWKKALEGRISIKLSTPASDFMKVRKCLEIHEDWRQWNIAEVRGDFAQDVFRGKVKVTFENDSSLTLDLDENGYVWNEIKVYDENDKMSAIFHCQNVGTFWTRKYEKAWVYSETVEGRQIISNGEDMKQFYACKALQFGIAISCLDVSTFHRLPNSSFVVPKSLEVKDSFDLDLSSSVKAFHRDLKQIRHEKCMESKTVLDWIRAINTNYMMEDIEIKPFLMGNLKDQNVIVYLPEFEHLKQKPVFARLIQNGKEIFQSKVEYQDGHAKMKMSSQDLPLDTTPVVIKFSLRDLNVGNVLPNDAAEKEVATKVVGHLCQNGRLCGRVKQYGWRLRQRLCETFLPNFFASISYQDPTTGQIKGSTFHVLVGGSILYSPNGKYPADNAAYIYHGADFAIVGSFDPQMLLSKGQKYRFYKEGCDENSFPVLKFGPLLNEGTVYHFKAPTSTEFGDQPNVIDEVGEAYAEVKWVDADKDEGLFAKVDISPDTLIAQHGGFLFEGQNMMEESLQSPGHPYLHRLNFCDDRQMNLDIPKTSLSLKSYNGTIAHKANHSFKPNAMAIGVDSARFGLTAALLAISPIKKGEEILVNYGYDVDNLDEHKQWYLDEWHAFNSRQTSNDNTTNATIDGLAKAIQKTGEDATNDYFKVMKANVKLRAKVLSLESKVEAQATTAIARIWDFIDTGRHENN